MAIQAALDLATSGFKVFLVERNPTIGGKMAQLDKTFPTNDCSMCIESPKFIECDRHPNIEILTYTEVDAVEGEAGDFSVTLTRKPRYVNEDLCTGCTVCAEYCPIAVPDQFNQELSSNKAIHIYFSQAVPLVPYIDDRCRYLEDEACTICEGVCKNKAIDLRQKPEKQVLKVGAVVLAPGYAPFDPLARREFWHRINALAAQHVTVLVTTHFMEEAEYCDRLAIMVLQAGTPLTLMRSCNVVRA